MWVHVVLFSREDGEAITVCTGLDDWLNDLMSYIPDVALSYMVRWKKRKSTCQKGKRLVQFTNSLLSKIRPKLAGKIISKVANLPCPLDNLQ